MCESLCDCESCSDQVLRKERNALAQRPEARIFELPRGKEVVVSGMGIINTYWTKLNVQTPARIRYHQNEALSFML